MLVQEQVEIGNPTVSNQRQVETLPHVIGYNATASLVGQICNLPCRFQGRLKTCPTWSGRQGLVDLAEQFVQTAAESAIRGLPPAGI
jgi:hypothetical protein